MNYKETLFFIAQCLTISFEEKNKEIVLIKLKSDEIDWDAVVKVSTSHYVFPALYCNLRRAGYLKYIPEELVSYMKYITDLNREQNKQIISQAKKINTLLIKNNIKPIFLKGTGNLLAKLYLDVAERMVGDIDFILSKQDYSRAIQILYENGYEDVIEENYHFPTQKHYRRIKKKNNISALEIHHDLLRKKYYSEFNYSIISKDIQNINGFNVLSYSNKLNLSIIADQINDYGYYLKRISLRNAYDVFLLSKKTNAKNCFIKFKKLQNPLNCFLAGCFLTFGKIDSLKYVKTIGTDRYLQQFKSVINGKNIIKLKIKTLVIYFYKRFVIVQKIFTKKEYRKWFINKILDKKWYQKKLFKFLNYK
tara:strand:+ start:2817 stop:3908 length:1092 start_codon:yes stop_codon:yes gene_type:complete